MKEFRELAMSNSHELITDYQNYRGRLTELGEHTVHDVFAGGLLIKIHTGPNSRIVSAVFDPQRELVAAVDLRPNGRPVSAPFVRTPYTSKPGL
jgi:hypothetical protein